MQRWVGIQQPDEQADKALAYGSVCKHQHDFILGLSCCPCCALTCVTLIQISDVAAMKALKLRPKEAGTLLLGVFAEMAFQRGLVHGDPHPGAMRRCS